MPLRRQVPKFHKEMNINFSKLVILCGFVLWQNYALWRGLISKFL